MKKTNQFITLVVILVSLFLPSCTILNHIQVSRHLPELHWTLVPGGTFEMGDFENNSNKDAIPLHNVTLPSFYINTYEITYAQYDSYADLMNLPKPDDEGFGREDRAVVNISWDEAKAFCECYNGRLPTEVEWEFAAREGGKEILFPGTNLRGEVDDFIRHEMNSVGYSYYVGSKKPNGLGIYDMGGNVYEWIGDFYPEYPDSNDTPVWVNYDEYTLRIIRGGSFWSPPTKTYVRAAKFPESSTMVGFRCVKDIE